MLPEGKVSLASRCPAHVNVAAAALTNEELRTIVTQTEALAIPRPMKTGKKSG